MLPYLTSEAENSKKYIVQFQGLNMGEGGTDGESSETENISSVLSPCITQRFGRVLSGQYTAPTAMHAKEGLLVIDGTDVKYDGAVVLSLIHI